MRNLINRLQALERLLYVKPTPTFEQFKREWVATDALSQAVIVAEVESGDFESWDKPWRRYMLAVRSYLLQMGLIDEYAETFRQIAAEMDALKQEKAEITT